MDSRGACSAHSGAAAADRVERIQKVKTHVSRAASKSALEALHEALATAFTNAIDNGIKVMTKSGEVETVNPPAAYMKVIADFLKDNDIKAAPTKGSPMGELVDRLPFAGSDHPAHMDEQP